MKELVFQGQNSQALTNSLLVAEKFGKEHRNVMQSISNLISSAENSVVLNMFVETSYIASNGKENPMYVMNRDGFTLLAMGFTGSKALQFKIDYIAAFNAMEKQIKAIQVPVTYADALRQLADEVEAKQKTQILLEQKTEQLDESQEWYSIKRWAKEHHMNWRNIDWRKLKAISYELGYEIKKIFDGNYGQVNIYHRRVFEAY